MLARVGVDSVGMPPLGLKLDPGPEGFTLDPGSPEFGAREASATPARSTASMDVSMMGWPSGPTSRSVFPTICVPG